MQWNKHFKFLDLSLSNYSSQPSVNLWSIPLLPTHIPLTRLRHVKLEPPQ